jgi:hypothetical protein
MNLMKLQRCVLPGLVYVALTLSGCAGERAPSPQLEKTGSNETLPNTLFLPTQGVLNASDRERRKWDGPIVGDLDNDGLQDLLLTEHAHRVNILWNQGGTFSPPQTLISGDMHGTAIADFDNDGAIEVVIAQGGGNGSNPRKPLVIEISNDRKLGKKRTLEHFEKGRGRSVKVFDANQDGLLDLFLTGFATPEQLKTGANHMYQNIGNGEFRFIGNLPYSQRLSYKSIVTDFNQDNDPDIMIFGGGQMVASTGQPKLGFKDTTSSTLGELAKINHVSAIAQSDVDGDGDLDLILSRAKHQFKSQTFYDAEQKNFAFFARFQPYEIGELTILGKFEIHNLQMAFPDFDIFMGQNKTKVDGSAYSKVVSHEADPTRQEILRVEKDEAKGWPLDVCIEGSTMKTLSPNSKPGLYIGYLGNNKWKLCSQTRSATAGVVKNVTYASNLTSIDRLPAKLLINDNGVFTDATSQFNIDIQEPTSGVVAADFDNDGWDDLLFIKYGDMSKFHQPKLYLNKQGNGFYESKTHGVLMDDLGATGAGADVIDFDRDGDYDLVTANERGKWRLFENTTAQRAENNFIGVTLRQPTNTTALVGTKVKVTACGREITKVIGNSSSSYATSVNTDLLFGLGICNQVDLIEVTHSNGISKSRTSDAVNEYIKI